jgi:hypothetical protein
MPLASGRWGYYFKPPTWALKPKAEGDRGPCLVPVEALSTDYDTAVKRAELVLLPSFEAWRTRGAGDLLPAKGVQRGSLDRLFAIYRETNRYKALGRKVKRLHEQGFRLVGDHVRKSGRRFGEAMLPYRRRSRREALQEAAAAAR